MARLRRALVAGLVVGLALSASVSRAAKVIVHAGGSIQAALDAAPAGSTIVVEPGTYHEPGATRALTVTRNGIRLVARSSAGQPVVIEQSGTQTQGIWVSPADSLDPADVELPPCGDSGSRLTRFALTGFTVQGFAGFGVYLACVDGFQIRDTTARANDTYAIFPVRSARGRMTRNVTSGTKADACLYVGQDDRIVVNHNTASDCLIGLQIENSRHVRMSDNESSGNTTGIIVDIVNGRQVTVEADNRVTGNLVHDNNRPNTAPPELDTSRIPLGIGLIIDGADRTLVAHNTITGHQLFGLTLVDFCTGTTLCDDPGLDIDPLPERNRIVRNRFQSNGSDVVFLPGDGRGNCFAGNVPATLNVIGGPLPVCR